MGDLAGLPWVCEEVDISDNEWSKACNLRERYRLYVVFDCTATHPRLMRVQDPWSKFQVKPPGFILDLKYISFHAESDNGLTIMLLHVVKLIHPPCFFGSRARGATRTASAFLT
jgi:hypothetical protein